ncbi:MAG: hypothetical protein IJT06_03960, partial [Selenomonadaceae bacterium]|nr:hypothetical protein [Selenomonadaceae bacterium]
MEISATLQLGKFEGGGEMIFDLQKFGGGKGGVTYQTTAYEPTEYELKLQQLQSEFVEDIMPNAKDMNTIAKTILVGSLGDDPLDFSKHLNDAHTRYDEAYAALYQGAEWISAYITELDNRSGEFETANGEYDTGLTNGWNSERYTDADGNLKSYPGFWDFSAHVLYDHAEVAMDEIATTLRAVANGIHTHFHDVIGGYQQAQDETRHIYQKIVKSEDNVNFEKIAADNLNDLVDISKGLKDASAEYVVDSQKVPVKIEDSAKLSNASLEGFENGATLVADTNYNDLDALIPKFTVTADIVDSLVGAAADDLKGMRDKNRDDLENIVPKLYTVESGVRSTLESYVDKIEPAREGNYTKLADLREELPTLVDSANVTLKNFIEEIKPARDKNYSELETLPAAYDSVTIKSNATFESFIDDIDPTRDKNYYELETLPS